MTPKGSGAIPVKDDAAEDQSATTPTDESDSAMSGAACEYDFDECGDQACAEHYGAEAGKKYGEMVDQEEEHRGDLTFEQCPACRKHSSGLPGGPVYRAHRDAQEQHRAKGAVDYYIVPPPPPPSAEELAAREAANEAKRVEREAAQAAKVKSAHDRFVEDTKQRGREAVEALRNLEYTLHDYRNDPGSPEGLDAELTTMWRNNVAEGYRLPLTIRKLALQLQYCKRVGHCQMKDNCSGCHPLFFGDDVFIPYYDDQSQAWVNLFHDLVDEGEGRRASLALVLGTVVADLAAGNVYADHTIDLLRRPFTDAMGSKTATSKKKMDHVRAGEEFQLALNVAVGAAMTLDVEAHRALRVKGGELLPPAVIRAVAVIEEDEYGFDFTMLENAPTRQEILTGFIEAAAITLLLGRFSAYKTFVAIAWGLIVASAGQWDDDHVAAEAVPVVYVAAEDPAGVRARARVFAKALHLTVAPGMFTVYHRTVRLNDKEQMAELTAYCIRKGAKVVIFDTLHKLVAGMTEGNDTAGVAYAAIDDLMNATGAGALVLHHTGFAGEHARNSSALEDDAAMVFLIDFKGEDRRRSNPRSLTTRKVRNGELPEPQKLVLNVLSKTEAYVTPEPTTPAGQWSPEALATALDADGVPDTTGETVLMRWVLENEVRTGLTCSARTVRKAIALRKPEVEEPSAA